MSSYFVLKAVQNHQCSLAVAIRVVSEKVVLEDWLFTLPTIVVQAVAGLALARMLGIRYRVAGWPGHLRCSNLAGGGAAKGTAAKGTSASLRQLSCASNRSSQWQ